MWKDLEMFYINRLRALNYVNYRCSDLYRKGTEDHEMNVTKHDGHNQLCVNARCLWSPQGTVCSSL